MNLIAKLFCRKGHRPRRQWRRVYRDPILENSSRRHYVVIKVQQISTQCGRCHLQLRDWVDTRKWDGYHSFTCPSEMMQRINDGEDVVVG